MAHFISKRVRASHRWKGAGGKGVGSAREMCGKCLGNVWEVCGECVESVWEVRGKCVGSAREAVLEVVGSVELSPNTCKTIP